MNVFQTVKEYIDRMIPADGSMKVLLLDKSTVPILSTSYTQSMLLERGVFLIDQCVNRNRMAMKSMRCVIFVRPTKAALSAVAEEIKEARYSSYTLGFSNALPTDALNQLATADEQELVTRVEEYFADFVALNADLCVMPSAEYGNIPPPLVAAAASHAHINRIVQGLTATCLAFRRKPLIRMNNQSPYAKAVATSLATAMKHDAELFDYRARDTVILVVDRADDPLTPLLMQWTYQAMLHELVGLEFNRLDLPNAPADAEDKDKSFVFSQQDDKFFAANMYSNWGELCQNVKAHVQQYKEAMNIDRSTASVEELKALVANLPQARQQSNSVTKHITVVTHLSEVIRKRGLLEISLLEQNMASDSNEKDHWNRIVELNRNPDVDKVDVTRLCMIYNLRYEKVGKGSKAEALLMGTPYFMLVRNFRELFGDRSPATIFNTGVVKSVISYIKGFKEEQNIYTQHEPLLKRTLTALAQGKLDNELYPYLQPPSNPTFKPKEVIVCMVGGTTYEEAALVNKINADPAIVGNIKVVLTSPMMLNTREFMAALDPAQ